MIFKKNSILITTMILGSLFVSKKAFCRDSGMVGLNLGFGIPYISQGGLDLRLSDSFSLQAEYNLIALKVESTTVSLGMPAAILKWHPFKGAFFIGAGVGQETLTAKATDDATSNSAKIEIKALTTIGQLGWMWGLADGGFWFGVDVSYISPSSPKTTITSDIPTTDQTYLNVQDQADKFGQTAYYNITFARLGWIF